MWLVYGVLEEPLEPLINNVKEDSDTKSADMEGIKPLAK
jgi:hypothetical protein